MNGAASIATAFVSYPKTDNNSFVILYNPACCLSVKFWNYNELNRKQEDNHLSLMNNYFSMEDFIKESYWPYETDLEKQMPISACMTIVHLLKKRYLVIIFSPCNEDNETMMKTSRRKSSLFVLEIPVAMGESNLSSWDDDSDASKISKFKVKEARKLYVNENEEILDPIINVSGCAPHFEEFFACYHESRYISIWTVKGSRLKQISLASSVQLATSIPDFMSLLHYQQNEDSCTQYSSRNQDAVPSKQMLHKGHALTTFTVSYLKQLEKGNGFILNVIDVFSGNANIEHHFHGHDGSVGKISCIPIRKTINNSLTSAQSSCFSNITTIEIGNAIKRKWNT